MRRTMLLVAAMALVLLLAAGMALAQTFGDQRGQGVTRTCNTSCIGTEYPDTLKGTNNDNTIKGEGRFESVNFGDLIQGHGGNDALIGGTGRDHINAGSGSDSITAKDGYKDIIDCGSSTNDRLVSYDKGLDVFRDCERR